MELATLLLVGVGAFVVLTLAFFGGEDIAVSRITVPEALEVRGYTDAMVTETLTDEMRQINESAALELAGIDLQKSTVNESLESLEDYFGLYDLVAGIKTAFSQIDHHVEGTITEDAGEIVITTRLSTVGDTRALGEQIVHLTETRGDVTQVRSMLHEHAIRILDVLQPYIVALYYYRQEIADGEFEFRRTREQLDRFMKQASAREHYLAYDLIGRMHRHRGDDMPGLSPEQRRAEFLEAARWLQAAIVQKPDFFYAHIHLGLIQAKLGRYDLADAHFANAVRLRPNDLRSRVWWGGTLAEQGRIREAIFQYVAAVEIAPEEPELRHTLAELYVKAGRPDAARRQWEAAVVMAPMNQTYQARLRSLGAPAP